jgi:hypothetical protein
MGSDPQDLSLIRFKEKWGSQTLDIYTYVKDYHPIQCKIWELGKKMGSSRLGSWLVKTLRPSPFPSPRRGEGKGEGEEET